MTAEILIDISTPPSLSFQFGAAWACFCLLGVGLLFPFNCYIAASTYFNDLYPNVPYTFLMSMAYNFFSWILLFVSSKIMPKFSFRVRINAFLLMGAAILFLIPFISKMIPDRTASMVVSLILTFLSGSISSLLFGTVMGLTALFPFEYTGAVMSGCGVAGIIASVLRIITYVSMPASALTASSYLYFFLAGGLLIICFLGFIVLLNLPITRHYLAVQSKNNENSINNSSSGGSTPQVDMKQLLRKVWREAFVVFTVFFTTLSLFPGITGLVENINSGLSSDWFGILFTLTFMVGDLIGRTAPKWFIIFTPNNLWMPTVARLVFFVLFALCVKPLVFKSIAFYFVFMFLFSLSNGYLGTLAMMFGPTKASEHEKEVTGIIMSFFLNFGIWVATWFSLLLLFLITGNKDIFG
ncbi:equilibrative nucleoside transporter family protein [Cavenderia fasciculata]|uniref:Equilibrative nucleoside transporter family protein n=1 Tax=Cavenderia fasciculata TaxID=261658 RepID=F4PKX6_CACFS|nr:equilibrative nucleoside transporter family protein [Cavenderia fasciculata]EGG23198.1 equilibrative nucleoside transporter family protein [Cavenderia fasciculata]|eukprot:XP_004361049.1 equilibrative nucleoside transporter family protein [Cavenderia fasciculata]